MFGKLFKHAEDHKARHSKPQENHEAITNAFYYRRERKTQSSLAQNALIRSRSQCKIESKMKNIERMMSLADSELKNSHKKKKNESSAKKPPLTLNSSFGNGSEKPSNMFTLKNKAFQSSFKFKKGTKRHQSSTNDSLMNILQPDKRTSKDLSLEANSLEGSKHQLDQKRFTMNPNVDSVNKLSHPPLPPTVDRSYKSKLE